MYSQRILRGYGLLYTYFSHFTIKMNWNGYGYEILVIYIYIFHCLAPHLACSQVQTYACMYIFFHDLIPPAVLQKISFWFSGTYKYLNIIWHNRWQWPELLWLAAFGEKMVFIKQKYFIKIKILIVWKCNCLTLGGFKSSNELLI